jgi:serine/threonine protein kinase
MLTGVTPFRGDTPLAVLMGHVNRPLPDPLQYNPRLSPQIVQVLRKSLSKNREERYKTCREFAEAFEKAVDLSTMSLPTQPPVMPGEATMVQALTPQQVYDLALEQERHGNYQAAYETLSDLNRQFPNYADVPTRLSRYEMSNYRYTGTHSMYRPSSTATSIPAAGPTQVGAALPTQIGGPYTPPPIQTAATEVRSYQPTGNTPPPQNFYVPPTTGNYPVTQKSGGNKGLLVLGIVGGLALVAVAVLVILLVTSGKPNPTQVSNTTPAVYHRAHHRRNYYPASHYPGWQ